MTMTPRLHDQQQVLLPQDTYPFMPASHQASRTSLLDSDERGYIDSFFDNPEDVVNQPNLLPDSSYAFNPFGLVPEASAHTDMSHIHSSAATPNGHMGGQMLYPGQHEPWLTATHEVQNAASALAGFHASTHMPSSDTSYNGSWGNVTANGFTDTGASSNPATRQHMYSYPAPAVNYQPPSWHNPMAHQQAFQYTDPQNRRDLALDTASARFEMQQRQQQQQTGMPVMLDSRTRPSPVRFGSDDNFSNGGYQAPVYQRGQRDRSGALLNIPFAVEAIKPEIPTSSPAQAVFATKGQDGNARESNIADLPTPTSAHQASWNNQGQTMTEAENESDDAQEQQPRKRRKAGSSTVEGSTKKKLSRSLAEENDEANTKRRKSVQVRASSPQSNAGSESEEDDEEVPSSARKRKEKKQPRQNLSDKQKRENHIMSEKKRRQLIKTGYADLNKLVPALAEGKTGLSRSESLFECQIYLEGLLVGTKQVMEALGIGEKELCDKVGVEVGAIALKNDQYPD
jgi:hypothetical protein